MSGPAAAPGLLASLRRLVATSIEIAQVRIELLAAEFEQEKLRVFDSLLWAALALLLLAVGLGLGAGLLLMLFWDGYRLPALALLCGLFLGAGAWVARLARRHLSNPGGSALDASLGELTRDRESLRGRE